jgi:hypothetical protein
MIAAVGGWFRRHRPQSPVVVDVAGTTAATAADANADATYLLASPAAGHARRWATCPTCGSARHARVIEERPDGAVKLRRGCRLCGAVWPDDDGS